MDYSAVVDGALTNGGMLCRLADVRIVSTARSLRCGVSRTAGPNDRSDSLL